jgi:hypothetical protein
MAERKALIVASSDYDDPKLKRLRAPGREAEDLAGLLRDRSIGEFSEVSVLTNEPEYKLRRAVGAFFNQAHRDDFLMLHLACHGVKDDDGNLYFAASDTDIADLHSTAIPDSFVRNAMDRSRSRQIVLMLDCCYSGAFGKGMAHRGGGGMQVMERFHGQGRAVLTASDSMEYAWEGEELDDQSVASLFTGALVRGLSTGEADLDGDGYVSIEELYDYIEDRVKDKQRPRRQIDLAGSLYIARNPQAAEHGTLPDNVLTLTRHPFADVRLSAIDHLARYAEGTHLGLAAAAERELGRLAADDSKQVSAGAAHALSEVRQRTRRDEAYTQGATAAAKREEPEARTTEDAEPARDAAERKEPEARTTEDAEPARDAAERKVPEARASEDAEPVRAEAEREASGETDADAPVATKRRVLHPARRTVVWILAALLLTAVVTFVAVWQHNRHEIQRRSVVIQLQRRIPTDIRAHCEEIQPAGTSRHATVTFHCDAPNVDAYYSFWPDQATFDAEAAKSNSWSFWAAESGWTRCELPQAGTLTASCWQSGQTRQIDWEDSEGRISGHLSFDGDADWKQYLPR